MKVPYRVWLDNKLHSLLESAEVFDLREFTADRFLHQEMVKEMMWAQFACSVF